MTAIPAAAGAQNADGGGLRYTMSNATIDNVAYAMEECGIVIFDSHGDIDAYNSQEANNNYLCLTTADGITTADTARQTSPDGITYYKLSEGQRLCGSQRRLFCQPHDEEHSGKPALVSFFHSVLYFFANLFGLR